jgi:hypothetical protein
MTHTPGPWSFEQIGVTDAGPNHDDVFDIGPCDREGAMRKRIATVVGDDARLIAAAPELLAALQAFMRAPSIGSSGPGSVTIEVQTFNLDAARQAIAKATQ